MHISSPDISLYAQQMRFSVLASGSSANSSYIEHNTTRILIDCGLSASELERRLLTIGVCATSLDAILVTHEHRDHVNGVGVLARRYNLPVYCSAGTRAGMATGFEHMRIYAGERFEIGDLQVEPFAIPHDAREPLGYRIEADNNIFVQATDIGCVTDDIYRALEQAHSIVLESNHDPQLLKECGYPTVLKQRIASDLGHISNEQAGKLIASVLHADLQHVVLAHLSENSNTVQLAYEVSRISLNGNPTSLRCAKRREPTPLLEVGSSGSYAQESLLAIASN